MQRPFEFKVIRTKHFLQRRSSLVPKKSHSLFWESRSSLLSSSSAPLLPSLTISSIYAKERNYNIQSVQCRTKRLLISAWTTLAFRSTAKYVLNTDLAPRVKLSPNHQSWCLCQRQMRLRYSQHLEDVSWTLVAQCVCVSYTMQSLAFSHSEVLLGVSALLWRHQKSKKQEPYVLSQLNCCTLWPLVVSPYLRTFRDDPHAHFRTLSWGMHQTYPFWPIRHFYPFPHRCFLCERPVKDIKTLRLETGGPGHIPLCIVVQYMSPLRKPDRVFISF